MIPSELQTKLDQARAEVAALDAEADELDATIRQLQSELKTATARRDTIRPPWGRDRGTIVIARCRLATVEREVSDHERVKVARRVVVAAGPKRVTLRMAGGSGTDQINRAKPEFGWSNEPIPADELEAAIDDYQARRKAGKVTS